MQVSDQQRIGDRYDLRQVIGIGGMARVYLAHDRALNRDVAVKILNPALAADPLFVERFRREAQAAAALNHANIVMIYDTGTTDDTYYIVMEFVPGPNLKELLRERGPLPEREVLHIGAAVAAALAEAHKHHLIHRDVKSHNVLIGPEGHVKVTDFGIARAAGTSHLTAAQTVMGSAPYLSPEQALHQPLDERADLYSLGVVLYEALTGRLPFAGESLVAVAMMHVHEQPPALRALRPDVSPETEAVILRAMAKDPAARFQSAAEMRAALLHALETVPATPTEETRAIPFGVAPPTIPIAAPVLPPAPPPGRFEAAEPLAPAVYNESPRHARRFLMPLILAGVLCAVVVAGILALGRTNGATAATATPASATTVALAPTATATTSPRPTATLRPIVAPAATAVPTAQPTPTPLAPPTPTPIAAPTATAAPQPTATAQPAPTATTVSPSAVTASSPAQAVQLFYQYAAQHQWDAAAALWSDSMKQQYPIDANLIGHFNPATRIDVRIGQVQVNGDRATVAVDLTEIRDAPPPSRRYVGSWEVIRGPNGWVLNQPELQPA